MATRLILCAMVVAILTVCVVTIAHFGMQQVRAHFGKQQCVWYGPEMPCEHEGKP